MLLLVEFTLDSIDCFDDCVVVVVLVALFAVVLLESVAFWRFAACAIAALRASEYAALLVSGGGVVLGEGATSPGFSVGVFLSFFLSSGGKTILRPLFITTADRR